MRRALIATMGTAAGLVALLGYKSSGPATAHRVVLGPVGTTSPVPAQGGQAGPATSGSAPTAKAGPAPTRSAPAASAPAAAGTSAPTTTPARRSFVGQLVQYFYGDIQVEVTMQGSRIVSITVPQNGAADARSQMINSYAVPILEQEALAAQGLNFNAVTGATFTSDAFAQSLQSALQAAGK